MILPLKPMPVATVCELEQVKGTGTPGTMDNLERSMTNLQVLPNPSQGDGRNGSWSWYPQTVNVSLEQDTPTNKVIQVHRRRSQGLVGHHPGVPGRQRLGQLL
jgi:hypothetical protein